MAERRVWRVERGMVSENIAEAKRQGCTEIQEVDGLAQSELYVEQVAEPEVPLEDRMKALEESFWELKARVERGGP